MFFTHYHQAAAFSEDTLAVIMKHELQNNLLLKNIGDGPDKTMVSIKDGSGKVALTAIRTGSFPMVLFETDNVRNDEAVACLAAALVKGGIEVNLVLGEPALAQCFAALYGKVSGKTFWNNENLVLYRIDAVNALPQVSGSFRLAEQNDMDCLPYWCADFAPACGIGDYNLSAGIETTQNMINGRRLFVWDDGGPVSMAGAVREVTGCKVLGQVYTPPHFRGRGYSTACVAALTQKLLDDGYEHCALYADCKNPYSNAVYRKIGYQPVGYCDKYAAE